MIVFGGENEHREYLSDVVILDLETFTWTLPDIQGSIPRGRARHAAVIHDGKLFIVGGVTGENNVILDDLTYLDLQTWTWSRTWSFTARFDHTAWVWGSRLWIFGGLGPNMERTTDIWWLDLKRSPSLAGIANSQGMVDSPDVRIALAYVPGSINSPSSQPMSPRSGAYTANSASVQVRNLGRRKPLAPGAISCLRFHSGPHVPALFSGTHFHSFASGALLDLITPSETVRSHDCNLSALDLNSLRWQRLADGQEIFRPGYRWHYCTVNETGTKAWLLGCSLDLANAPGASDENHMSEILSIDLEKYGLLGNSLSVEAPEQDVSWTADQNAPVSGLGADLSSAFDQSPESGGGTDFVITAVRDDHDFTISDDTETTPSASPTHGPTFVEVDPSTSAPIHVHKIILQLRWPHFKRLYAAQMAEYHTKRMHIPEPYSAVRAFLYYLYTDSIAGHPEYCSSVIDVAGMLVMANLYDMPKLRLLCVNRLSRELDVDNAAIVWERAGRTNEHWLMRRAAQFCLTHWGRVVRTEGFKSLSRQSLIEQIGRAHV